jgi:hypothetical protein
MRLQGFLHRRDGWSAGAKFLRQVGKEKLHRAPGTRVSKRTSSGPTDAVATSQYVGDGRAFYPARNPRLPLQTNHTEVWWLTTPRSCCLAHSPEADCEAE